jgi:hypothetical protein
MQGLCAGSFEGLNGSVFRVLLLHIAPALTLCCAVPAVPLLWCREWLQGQLPFPCPQPVAAANVHAWRSMWSTLWVLPPGQCCTQVSHGHVQTVCHLFLKQARIVYTGLVLHCNCESAGLDDHHGLPCSRTRCPLQRSQSHHRSCCPHHAAALASVIALLPHDAPSLDSVLMTAASTA